MTDTERSADIFGHGDVEASALRGLSQLPRSVALERPAWLRRRHGDVAAFRMPASP
jgi:hypothetical protein